MTKFNKVEKGIYKATTSEGNTIWIVKSKRFNNEWNAYKGDVEPSGWPSDDDYHNEFIGFGSTKSGVISEVVNH